MSNPKNHPVWPDVVKPADMSIGLLWKLFEGHVIPVDASAIQRDEMKKAFFAGFTECFKVMNDYAVTLDESAAVKLFTKLSEESHAFYERMKREHPT